MFFLFYFNKVIKPQIFRLVWQNNQILYTLSVGNTWESRISKLTWYFFDVPWILYSIINLTTFKSLIKICHNENFVRRECIIKLINWHIAVITSIEVFYCWHKTVLHEHGTISNSINISITVWLNKTIFAWLTNLLKRFQKANMDIP